MKVVHLTGESRYEEKNQQKHSNYEENEVFQKMNFTDSGKIYGEVKSKIQMISVAEDEIHTVPKG